MDSASIVDDYWVDYKSMIRRSQPPYFARIVRAERLDLLKTSLWSDQDYHEDPKDSQYRHGGIAKK